MVGLSSVAMLTDSQQPQLLPLLSLTSKRLSLTFEHKTNNQHYLRTTMMPTSHAPRCEASATTTK